MSTPPWPTARSEKLVALAMAGRSMGHCARTLHVSRSAIAGRARRMGLSFKCRAIIAKPPRAPRPPPPSRAEWSRKYMAKRRTLDFDVDTDAEILAVAKREKCSVSEAIRLLVEWGLIEMREGLK